jgi:hypothetical protein
MADTVGAEATDMPNLLKIPTWADHRDASVRRPRYCERRIGIYLVIHWCGAEHFLSCGVFCVEKRK